MESLSIRIPTKQLLLTDEDQGNLLLLLENTHKIEAQKVKNPFIFPATLAEIKKNIAILIDLGYLIQNATEVKKIEKQEQQRYIELNKENWLNNIQLLVDKYATAEEKPVFLNALKRIKNDKHRTSIKQSLVQW